MKKMNLNLRQTNHIIIVLVLVILMTLIFLLSIVL